MTPIATFEAAWARCEHLCALHAYLAANVTAVLQPAEILRAEWAARVSAVDLYVHELVAQGVADILAGTRPQAIGFAKFPVDAGSVLLLKQQPAMFHSQIDLEIRSKLERRTFQFPADILEGVKYIPNVELWNAVALQDGATEQTKTAHARSLKSQLTQIVNRRNKIVHEADLQPTMPRTPWPTSTSDLLTVRLFLEKIVRAIDLVT